MLCKFSFSYIGTSSILSPSSEYIASVSSYRLSIRSTKSFDITHLFQCIDKIDKIEFSPDSCFILCALYSRSAIQVFSLTDKDWKCRINEGVAGIINAFWTPDSRHIAAESDFGIQLSVWSLIEGASVIISLPKPPYSQSSISQTFSFSDCGKFLAVVHRIELQDQIGVYSLLQQPMVGEISKFRARSSDVVAVHWVPSGTHLITVDSPLSYRFCVYTPMGELLANYEAYQNALGIRCLGLFRPLKQFNNDVSIVASNWASSNKFLAIGSYDGKIRLVSMYSWQVAFVLPLQHPRDMDAGFNCSNMLLNVEISTLGTGNINTLYGGDATLDNNNASINEDVIEQRQQQQLQLNLPVLLLPPQQQCLSSSVLYPEGHHCFETAEMNALYSYNNNNDNNILVNNNSSSSRSSDTCYVLRSLKVLPRLLPADISKQRAAAVTAASTANVSRPAIAAGNKSKLSGGNTLTATNSSHVANASTSNINTTAGITTSAGALTMAGLNKGPPFGVNWLGWSSSGEYLAAREESHPRCLWLWRPLQAQLIAVLVQLDAITCAQWRPLRCTSSNIPPTVVPASQALAQLPLVANNTLLIDNDDHEDVLAFCTASASSAGRVYFWSAKTGATWADFPDYSNGGSGINNEPTNKMSLTEGSNNTTSTVSFSVVSLRWSNDGSKLLLRGKESHCICEVKYNRIS